MKNILAAACIKPERGNGSYIVWLCFDASTTNNGAALVFFVNVLVVAAMMGVSVAYDNDDDVGCQGVTYSKRKTSR